MGIARKKLLCDATAASSAACVTACKNEHEVPWSINRRRVVTRRGIAAIKRAPYAKYATRVAPPLPKARSSSRPLRRNVAQCLLLRLIASDRAPTTAGEGPHRLQPGALQSD